MFKSLFIQAVIHEVQRIANTVPLSVPHCTTKDTELMGYSIPRVRSNWYGEHYSEVLWKETSLYWISSKCKKKVKCLSMFRFSSLDQGNT